MEKIWATGGFILLLTLTGNQQPAQAEGSLYQKQRLQRNLSERQYDLKLQQRQRTQPRALQPPDIQQKQQIQNQNYQQQLRQLDLYQRQRQSLLRERTDLDAQQQYQLLQREQQQQDLDLKLQDQPTQPEFTPLDSPAVSPPDL